MLKETKTCRKCAPVMSRTSLGGFISDLMKKRQMNNLTLAQAAGISEGAVRNLLKHGRDPSAKDPDARTLQRVAVALHIDPILLFRMAGYIPAAPSINTARAEFVADVFDKLSPDKQDAVMGLLEGMTDYSSHFHTLREMRNDPKNPLVGLDMLASSIVRVMANRLIADLRMTELEDVERIPPEQPIMQQTWGKLSRGTQERIKSLIRYKLALDYDPTMADPEWRR